MQRAILEALEVVGAVNTPGDDGGSSSALFERKREFLDREGAAVEASHIYAVRQVRLHLAHAMGKTDWLYGWDNTTGIRKPQWGRTRQVPSNRFQASFSRALAGLMARQVLRPVWPRWELRARVEYVSKC
jgi:hypothetical protein